MLFHVAIARDSNAAQVAQALITSIREVFGQTPLDFLACLFFPPHYADALHELVDALYRQLAPRVMVGCMGEGTL